jgi:hypothetical protein
MASDNHEATLWQEQSRVRVFSLVFRIKKLDPLPSYDLHRSGAIALSSIFERTNRNSCQK